MLISDIRFKKSYFRLLYKEYCSGLLPVLNNKSQEQLKITLILCIYPESVLKLKFIYLCFKFKASKIDI